MSSARRDAVAGLLLDLIGGAQPQLDGRDAAEWALLDRLAAEQRLQPLLHHRQRDNPAIPADLRAGWATAYRANAMRALAQAEDLRDCVGLLRAAGFAPIALKGSWLAHHAYPHPALRPLRDLDLLLDPETAIPAFRLLEAQGYRRYESDADLALEPLLKSDKHLPPLIAPRGTPIELHHRLWEEDGLLDHASPLVREDELRARAVTDAADLLYPCGEDMVVHLVVHAVYGHRLDCGPLVLTDLDYQLRREPPDWPAFWARAAREGWRPGARLLLELTRRHCNSPIDFSADEGPEVPEAILTTAPRMLVQDPGGRPSTYALTRVARQGLGRLVRRLARRKEARPGGSGLAGRSGEVLRDAMRPEVLQATRDMTRLSAWLDSEA